MAGVIVIPQCVLQFNLVYEAIDEGTAYPG